MTDAERHKAILEAIRNYTTEKTTSKKVARDALIAEGIYTSKGELRPEFGGPLKKPKKVA